MKVLALPKESRLLVVFCIVLQIAVVYRVVSLPQAALWPTVLAFFIGTYLADLITGIFHFGFDYVWPDWMPVFGPISVEFRNHHDAPMLDPSAWTSNLTRGAYMGVTFAAIAWYVSASVDSQTLYICAATLVFISLWGLGFHQIHSYAHMGSQLSADHFNAAVERISKLPKSKQKREFAILFEKVGIPPVVRIMQRCRLFLRPEIHWQHHNSFESDFSSLNGWSDSLTNMLFGPFARRSKAKKQLAKPELARTRFFLFDRQH